jgi:hypothetical protein
MEKFITPEDKELFPWLHCSPIIKTIEQQITASTKIKFAIEAIKRKLLAITTATNDGVYDDEVKYIERKILIMLKANDESQATVNLIKKTILKLEKTKLQAKEKDLITKQNETKTELDNTLETLIAKRHPNYHHPKGTWNDADKRAYARFTSAYEAILTANYDHRQLMHKKKKELKKQAIEKKKDEDNALLQLTRKDLNQTIASSMKAYIKKLKVNNQAVKTKNVQRPAANAGQKKTNKPKTVAKGKGNGKQTSRKNKRNGGGATRN